ncbi:MAG: hypothetical protein ACREH4_04740 [Vitreimonas sp.]
MDDRRSIVPFCLVMCVLAGITGVPSPVAAATTEELKARCSQLIAYFDRFGAGRSQNSDGRRNHTRLGAEIDCNRGLYTEGIATMEDLLRRKKFTPPPPGPNEPEDDG